VRFQTTDVEGVILIEPDVYRDGRGLLFESYQAAKYRDGGIDATFVQDNHSSSADRVLRGLHGQSRHLQAKLVRVLRGEIFDVAVDARLGSPTFRRWFGVRLSAENFLQLYVPAGFLHGFCVLGDGADVAYKCTDYYDGTDQIVVRWDDPDIGIEWPIADPIVSAQDRSAPLLAEVMDRLPPSRDPA
jgi:dTDP-4-dehydrorhamnose 3,5-epimerase